MSEANHGADNEHFPPVHEGLVNLCLRRPYRNIGKESPSIFDMSCHGIKKREHLLVPVWAEIAQAISSMHTGTQTTDKHEPRVVLTIEATIPVALSKQPSATRERRNRQVARPRLARTQPLPTACVSSQRQTPPTSSSFSRSGLDMAYQPRPVSIVAEKG